MNVITKTEVLPFQFDLLKFGGLSWLFLIRFRPKTIIARVDFFSSFLLCAIVCSFSVALSEYGLICLGCRILYQVFSLSEQQTIVFSDVDPF